MEQNVTFNYNLSTIINCITLAVAIISPIIVACINNYHQTKIRKIDFYLEHRALVIEQYLSALGEITHGTIGSSEPFKKAGRNSAEMFLYVPENHWDILDKIESLISQRTFSNADAKELSSLSRELCKVLYNYPLRPKNLKVKSRK